MIDEDFDQRFVNTMLIVVLSLYVSLLLYVVVVVAVAASSEDLSFIVTFERCDVKEVLWCICFLTRPDFRFFNFLPFFEGFFGQFSARVA